MCQHAGNLIHDFMMEEGLLEQPGLSQALPAPAVGSLQPSFAGLSTGATQLVECRGQHICTPAGLLGPDCACTQLVSSPTPGRAAVSDQSSRLCHNKRVWAPELDIKKCCPGSALNTGDSRRAGRTPSEPQLGDG